MLRVLRAAGIASILIVGVPAPRHNAVADTDPLKAEIDGFLHRLVSSANGLVSWDGADTFDVKDEGDGAVATLTNAYLSLRKAADDHKLLATLTLDHLEIRRKPLPGGDMVEYDIGLPSHWNAVAADGTKVALSLDNAKAMAIVEGAEQHQRSFTFDTEGGRITVDGSASKGSFGPIAGNWKLASTDDGGWTSPASFEAKAIDFFIAEAPLGGSIDRIAYHGDGAGPSIAGFDAFRDQIAAVREKAKADPQQASSDLLGLLGKVITVFKSSNGELTVEGITAKRPEGEILVALKQATLVGALAGLNGDAAVMRLTIGHDGLTLAPSLLPAPQVPRRIVIDFGLEAIDGGVLGKIAETAAKLTPDASDDERRQTTIQILALAMSLQPVFRLYEAAVDFRDVSVEASGEAKRAPPAPIGFATAADIAVRNFDGLSEVLTSPNDRAEASLLKFIGEPGSNAAGDSVLKFHVTWGLGEPFKINGNDFSQWYVGSPANPRPPPSGQPRVLRPIGPLLTGDDVRAVQKALGVSKTDGVYDTATALAVMRFQKANGLDVNGVVDGSVRDKLGIALSPTPKMVPKN